MNKNSLIVALSVLGVLLTAGSADAHHSWQLDRSKMLTLSGTAIRFDFGNPHVQLYFQVKEDNGSTEAWQAGGPSPNQLAKGGWSRDTIKPGDPITVVGYQNRDGSKILRFDAITLASGQVLNGYRNRGR